MSSQRGAEQCKTCLYLHGGLVLPEDKLGHCYMFERAPGKNERCGQWRMVNKTERVKETQGETK